MNRLSPLLFFIFCLCLNHLFAQDSEEECDYQKNPFKEINQFPYIKDTAAFITKLKENCHIWGKPGRHKNESINYFKKVKPYGSNKSYYIIEYDFHSGAMTSFPWKKQLIFNTNGKLLKILSLVHLDVVKIFPASSPFLFGLSSTAKGNGIHQIFKINSDTLEQIYDGFLGNRPQTYSTGYSFHVNIPHELNHRFVDLNNDGYRDIIFYGKLRYALIDTVKIIPVKYIFLYHPKTGHFTEKEDYSKKYEYIYGNTK